MIILEQRNCLSFTRGSDQVVSVVTTCSFCLCLCWEEKASAGHKPRVPMNLTIGHKESNATYSQYSMAFGLWDNSAALQENKTAVAKNRSNFTLDFISALNVNVGFLQFWPLHR